MDLKKSIKTTETTLTQFTCEGKASIDFNEYKGKFILKIDTDCDGEESIKLTLNASEILDEVKYMILNKKPQVANTKKVDTKINSNQK